MFKNYLRVAIRNLKKRRGFAFINILGLAIGVACCLLIAMYVFHELSYDQFHTKADRIYRITQTTKTSAKEEKGASTPFPVAPALESDYPDQIAHSVRLFDMQEEIRTIRYKEADKSFRIDHFYFSDSTFFDVFSVNMVRGNPDEALEDPLSIVITQKQAQRFFGDENPMGKPLNFKGVADFTVTGVIESMPPTSHMKIQMLASFSSLVKLYGSDNFMQRWFWNPCWSYVLLEEEAAVQRLESQFSDFVDRNYADRAEGESVSLGLQPLTDIHLYSNLDQEMNPNGSIFYVYLFSAVAVLILIIACINFMNLSTARSTERAREIGMRKVLGADRSQLFWQFIGESFLISLLGIASAVGLVYLSLPWFNEFIGKQLSFSFFGNGTMIFSLLGLWILVGLFSGLYPALYLSGFDPTTIMHGSKATDGSGQLFRKGLVVFQFALSVMLIIGTVIVYLQLQHLQNKRLGFDEERVVVMPISQTLIAWEFQSFKEQALSSMDILEVSGSSKILASDKQTFTKFSPANQPTAPPTNMTLDVTYDFLETYNIDLLAGRSFSREYSTDSEQSIIINRSMLNQIDAKTPEEALGETFYFTTSGDERESYSVIGVVEDFNYTSVKKEIKPVVINLIEGVRPTVANIQYASVKLAPNGIQGGLTKLKEVWNKVNHIDPFTYSFHDEELQKIYASETKMSNVASVFSVLCILVACLGLFGLSSFTTSLRYKEIGIRKTLGASIPNILTLLSKDYLKLVLVANIVAWPVIYYLSVQWLQDFPNRISLGWNLVLIYLAVAIISILICIATVSYQSVRAALINPVDSIKQE